MKTLIRRMMAVFGFELVRSSKSRVSFDNFVSLARAYEQRLNEENDLIAPNETRPKLLGRLLGTPPSEAYFIIQALSKCRNISGDICEFGVAQGETSALIASEIKEQANKQLYLFDSFKGLPKPTKKDRLKDNIFSLGSIEAYKGKMSCPEYMVLARLKAIAFPESRYVIRKGFIEQLIREDKSLPKAVSFAYVDFDFYEPIKITLDFLHRVTPKGAIIIVDDYDFFSTGVKTAVDEFIAKKNSVKVFYSCFVPNVIYGRFVILTKEADNGD